MRRDGLGLIIVNLLNTDQHRNGSKYSALPRFLNKCYQSKIAGVRPRFQLELNILCQGVSAFENTNLYKTSDHRYVRQPVSGILASRNLRFSAVQSNCNIHFRLA